MVYFGYQDMPLIMCVFSVFSEARHTDSFFTLNRMRVSRPCMYLCIEAYSSSEAARNTSVSITAIYFQSSRTFYK